MIVFVMHQIIGTEGVSWLTVLGAFVLRGSIREVHEPWGNSALLRGMGWILTNTSFFPIQIAAGAYIWMETLQSLAASFDALGLDFARRAPYLCRHRDSDV
jgi:hypothetical protein